MSEFASPPELMSYYSIGSLCKTCGVSRKMVLNYEAHGLIEPIYTNKSSGYRYYGPPSVARICHIKALQKSGFSLNNIKQYFGGDDSVLNSHLDYLQALRTEIDNQISRTKALLTENGDFSIHKEKLPACDYITMTENCTCPQDTFALLWKLTGYIFEKGWQVTNKSRGLISIKYLNPSHKNYGLTTAAWSLNEPNEETVHFDETQALCINVKGSYVLLPKAISVLQEYAKTHNIATDGCVYIAYITSPQSHKNPEKYVTQVFLPIKNQFID